MPTLPSEPSPSVSESHRARAMAESFGADPERYDRTRPRYPDAMVERIVAAIPGREILDVGLGTGIVARQFEAAGCRVLGVEADARMAAWARERGHEVEVAKFEDWDPAGRRFDAVVSGQSWHWVDPVAGAAKAAGALRPGGLLGLFWNGFEPPAEVAEAFTDVYRRVMPDSLASRAWSASASAYTSLRDRAIDGIRRAGGFGEAEVWRFDWERTYTRDEWLDQVPTHGASSQLSPEALEEILTGLGAAIDALGGTFTMGFGTIVVSATV